MDNSSKDLKKERWAFFFALIAIEVFLFVNAYTVFENVFTTYNGGEDYWALLYNPYTILGIIDAILFVLFLTPLKPFEFLLFKSFACVGFFAYLQYCDDVNLWINISLYTLIGLLTRRLYIIFTSIIAVIVIVLSIFSIANI